MTNELKALTIVLGDPTRRAALLANEELCTNILENPELAPTLEAAILEDDHGIDALDILAALAAIIPAAPAAETFVEKMRKAKAAKAAKAPAKAEPVYTSRVTHYETGTVGKIKAGKEGSFSVNTVAIEQLDGERIIKRMMIGTVEAALIHSLPPNELAKLAPRTK
jgi:hypothetical protein